jgi:signal transduction histidine kinase/HAMP domain-containing protein
MRRWKNIVKPWKSHSITAKFSLAFAALLGLMLLISAISIVTLMITRRATEHTIFVSTHIQHLVLEMDWRLEKSRRLKRDFFLHYSRLGFSAAYQQYAQPAMEQATQVRQLRNELQAFIEQPEFSGEWRDHKVGLRLYLSAVDRHALTIEEAVALVSKLADEDSGIQTRLARHSSHLSDLFQAADDADLIRTFRDMQVFEKDYLITRQRPFMQSAFNVAYGLRQAVEHSSGLDADEKMFALDTLDAYQTVAEEMLDVNVAIRNMFQEFDLQALTIAPIAEELVALAHDEIERIRSQVGRISRSVTVFLLMTAVVGVGLAGVIAALLNRTITRNIVKLSRTARKFQTGRLHVRARIESDDELGQLAGSFNAMAAHIDELISGLEQKVADRTSELTASNQQLQQEIRERTRAEQRVETLNSILLAIRNVNQLIVREKDREQLLQQVCSNLIATRGYYSAWIALFDNTGTFLAAFESGISEHFPRLLEQLKSGKRTVCLKAALAQPDVVFFSDPPGACRNCPLANHYAGKAAMAARLEHGGQIYGALTVSMSKDLAIEEEEHALFLELTEDIAFALYNLDLEQQRRLMEDELRAHSEHLEDLVVERTAKLRDAQEQLLRREKLAVLGQMSGSVGHELRTPLSTISNAVYYLNMVLSDAGDDVREYLDIVASETRQAERIVSDLLGFSRVKPGTRTSLAVTDLVDLVIAKHEPPGAVRVTIKIAADVPSIFVDAHQMEQVLTNVITNAYQAMPDGGTLTISVSRDDNMIALAIRDTGCGISQENMSKLFEPLFTTKAKGIGLGLALSKTLIEANGGTIDVESDEGKGSVFTLRLPLTEEGK